MIRTTLFSLLLTSLLWTSGQAVDGVRCALDVYQLDHSTGNEVLLSTDTVDFVHDLLTTGFFITFGADITFSKIDSTGASFNAQMVTLGTLANTYSRKFSVEYGLPAKIDQIIGKNGSEYIFEITPIEMVDLDTALCPYDSETKPFKFTPSAHMDIHYVPNSFGDFYFGMVKGLLEDHYERMSDLYKFSLPGKYQIYLAPCPLYSIIWDKRFGITVNPTRSTGYAIYSMNLNTLDPFVIAHVAILRNFGFSPPFLSEGLAGFLSFAEFDMKKFLEQKQTIPLKQLMDTYQFFEADPDIADRTSASFVRYLIRKYSFERFKQLYFKADCLNLQAQLEETYGKTIADLEIEWLHYIDTLALDPNRILLHINESEAKFDYKRMLDYSKALAGMAESSRDSASVLIQLRKAYFLNGDYFNTIQVQKEVVKLSNNSRNWMLLGVYNTMNGFYDEARSDLLTAQSLDTNDLLIPFNLAMNSLANGNETEAERILFELVTDSLQVSTAGEARILLAGLLERSSNKEDRALAQQYYSEAGSVFERAISTNKPFPLYRMWLGLAQLGSGKLVEAETNLLTAMFLETRPFYQGMINLWMGKLADTTGNREIARQYYGRVIATPSSAYHQAEARKLLDKPFKR